MALPALAVSCGCRVKVLAEKSLLRSAVARGPWLFALGYSECAAGSRIEFSSVCGRPRRDTHCRHRASHATVMHALDTLRAEPHVGRAPGLSVANENKLACNVVRLPCRPRH